MWYRPILFRLSSRLVDVGPIGSSPTWSWRPSPWTREIRTRASRHAPSLPYDRRYPTSDQWLDGGRHVVPAGRNAEPGFSRIDRLSEGPTGPWPRVTAS